MPIKIEKLQKKTLAQRLAKFVETIKDGEGWTVSELCQKFNASAPNMNRAMRSLPCIKAQVEGRMQWFLINTKTYKNHAAKN